MKHNVVLMEQAIVSSAVEIVSLKKDLKERTESSDFWFKKYQDTEQELNYLKLQLEKIELEKITPVENVSPGINEEETE